MNVFLIAYINKNFGDDLFIDMICRRYAEHTFHIIASPEMADHLANITNLKIHKYNKIVRALNSRMSILFGRNFLMESLASRFKVCVCIGGSIFIQGQEWRRILHERRCVSRRTSKYCIVSANFGPFTDKDFAGSYEEWFGELTDVCFRDKSSVTLFDKKTSIRYSPDAIFGYENKADKKSIRKSKQLIVSCVDYSWRDPEKLKRYEQNMSFVVSNYLTKGWTVILLALCEQEGDACAVDRICNLLNGVNSSKLIKCTYDGNYSEIYSMLEGASFVISSRFHSTVIPIAKGVPVLPIPYSDKMRNMLKDLDYRGPIWEVDDENITMEQLHNAEHYSYRQNNIGKMALAQFEGVDKILGHQIEL